MAESTGNPALEVEIGGNISQLQAAIIAAENELRGFQAEIRKTTDTGRIAELSKSIQKTEQTIAGLRQEMGRSAGASNQAVNALGNVSRVAQDASYGFMGIANNLNPLFESFQRLQSSAGGTGNALKQMGSALTGPAGIGLAIGVVSSLIVSFGDDLTEFVNSKLSGFTDAMKLEAGVFKEAQQGYVKATEDINNLNQAHDDYTNGIISKEQFLKKFNSTLGDTIQKTDDLATAEKFLRDGAEQYIQMMYYKAVATEALNQAAKKQIEALQEQNAPLQPTLVQRAVSFLAPAGSASAEDRAAQSRKEKIDELGNDAYILKGIAENYKTLGDNIQYNLTRIFGAPAGNPTKEPDAFKQYAAQLKYDLQQELNDLEKWRKKFADLKLKPVLTFDPNQEKEDEKRKRYFDKKNKELLDESNKSGLGDFLTKDAAKRKDKYKQEEKQIKDLTDAYENFANMIASTVTNGIMNVFDAFEKGTDPLKAIGDMFLNIAKNIAAAILQATIFEAILTAFPELKAVFAASGTLMKAFSGGHAEGGITNGPSLGLIGEGGREAIIPLDKLNTFMNTSFNAGVMSGGGASGGGGGQFVLRGQDLLLATNRAQKASNLKGQSISLA